MEGFGFIEAPSPYYPRMKQVTRLGLCVTYPNIFPGSPQRTGRALQEGFWRMSSF